MRIHSFPVSHRIFRFFRPPCHALPEKPTFRQRSRKFLVGFILPSVLIAGTNNGSILLMNDSSFILTASIQAADGTFLGQFSVQPGQQINFTTDLNPTQYVHPGTPSVSLTPYTVIWQCGSEGYYSLCTGVSPGALCKANDCPGNHFCSPKKNPEKQAPASNLKKVK